MPPSTRQARKAAPTSTPNCMPPSTRQSSSQSSIHQHLKLHAPEHPAVKLAKQHPPAPQTACPPAPGRQARKAASTSTSNCMPPSTRPSISQSIHQHLKLQHPALNLAKQHLPAPQTACPLAPGRQARKASTSTSNCMPPSTRPSISQITFPSLLEVRTPIAFSYLGNKQTNKQATIRCNHSCLKSKGSLKEAQPWRLRVGQGI